MSGTTAAKYGKVIVLGPQRGFVEVSRALDDLDVSGRVAVITAGWQENEGEDEALFAALGRPAVNLALHSRGEAVIAADPEFATASADRQKRLQHMQEFYRMRLDAIDDAARAIAVRHVESDLLDEQGDVSIAQFRHLDNDHLARCRAVREQFDAQWRPESRTAVRRHRDAVAAIIEGCSALVIAGGHVMSLLNRLRLFGVFDAAGLRPVVAWSAGAMTLSERLVLFHDYPPFGKNLAQFLDEGSGHCRGVVILPDDGERLNTEDVEGMRRFVRRVAPAGCVVLRPGSRAVFDNGELLRASCVRLTEDGLVGEAAR